MYLKKLRPRYQKVFFGFFALIIFLELFSFGHDFEPLSRNEINYLKTKESYSSSIKFLKGDKDIFRIYPVYYENSAKTSPISNLYYNINSFYNIYSISGNNPFTLKDYHYFTYISAVSYTHLYKDVLRYLSCNLQTQQLSYSKHL